MSLQWLPKVGCEEKLGKEEFETATKICLKKLEDPFTKPPVPLPRPKKNFHQQPVTPPSAHSPINISSKDVDEFEEK